MEIFDDNIPPESYSDDDLVFHHQRGSYRQYEQPFYRDLATGKTGPKKGFFKVLLSSKGNKMTFFTMLMCVVLVFIVSILNGKTNTSSISGLKGTLSAFSFNDQVYSSVEFVPIENNKPVEPVSLKVLFECINAEGAVSDRSESLFEFDYLHPEPALAVFNDYDIVSVRCVLTDTENSVTLECKITNK